MIQGKQKWLGMILLAGVVVGYPVKSHAILKFIKDNIIDRNKTCFVKYSYGSRVSQEYNLGDVGGADRKADCKRRALGRSDLALNLLKEVVPNPSMSQCGSSVEVYADTRVEGKSNSRDGNLRVNLGRVIPAQYTCNVGGGSLQGTECLVSAPVKHTCPAGFNKGGDPAKGWHACVKILASQNILQGLPLHKTFGGQTTHDGFRGEYFVADGKGVGFIGGATPSCDAGFSLNNSICQKRVPAKQAAPASCAW
jgi:hypothetical protein